MSILFPSAHDDFSPQFLAEVWSVGGAPGKTAEEQLVLQNRFERFSYFLRQAIHTLFSQPFGNLVALSTVAVSVFLLSGFFLLLQNVEQILLSTGSDMSATVFLKDNGESAPQLLAELTKRPEIERVVFNSKQDALQQLREELGSRGSFLNGLENDNPLPASIDLVMKGEILEEKNEVAMQRLIAELRALPAVEDVLFGGAWLEQMRGLMRVVRVVGFAIALAVIVVIIFLISNTIKLVIYSRRVELSIMQLVGATDRVIALPFIIAGGLIGLVGSSLGLGTLYVVYTILGSYLREGGVLPGMTSGISLPVALAPTATFLGWSYFLLLLIGGMVVGAVSSKLAIGRHLEV
jgi:cell division transport system permease protein